MRQTLGRGIALAAGLLASLLTAGLEASPARAADETRPVVVFAAASLKTALDKIGAAWTAATGKPVTMSYAASSALAKQIEQGAPADIYASADVKWMNVLAEKKLIVPETRVERLGNRLVLIAPAGTATPLKIGRGFPLAEALGDGRLATGDPRSVPAGAYAEAALRSLGVWEAVAPKIAGAENVRAALAFVARKEAPLGIVYETDAKSEPLVTIMDTFPEETHPPIVYPVAMTSTSTNAAAKDFLDYLASKDATAIFRAEGFIVQDPR